MYERRHAEIEQMRARFDQQVAEGSPAARETADQYLKLLTDLISTVEQGPAADPQLMGLDTTGSLKEAEEFEAWAEAERHRVRRALLNIR